MDNKYTYRQYESAVLAESVLSSKKAIAEHVVAESLLSIAGSIVSGIMAFVADPSHPDAVIKAIEVGLASGVLTFLIIMIAIFIFKLSTSQYRIFKAIAWALPLNNIFQLTLGFSHGQTQGPEIYAFETPVYSLKFIRRATDAIVKMRILHCLVDGLRYHEELFFLIGKRGNYEAGQILKIELFTMYENTRPHAKYASPETHWRGPADAMKRKFIGPNPSLIEIEVESREGIFTRRILAEINRATIGLQGKISLMNDNDYRLDFLRGDGERVKI